MFNRDITEELDNYRDEIVPELVVNSEDTPPETVEEVYRISEMSVELAKAQAINNIAYSINRGDDVPTIGEGLVMIAESIKELAWSINREDTVPTIGEGLVMIADALANLKCEEEK